MHEASFPERPARLVRFRAGGRGGVVRAFYGVTPRPADSGFPALRGWEGEPRAGIGFPTIKCQVESTAPGYGSNLGWVQWVTQTYGGRRAPVRLVDRLPAFFDRDVPFATFGYAPTFFDAPAYTSLPEVDWRATLFLTTLPMMSRHEVVVPLAGFRWGYRVEAKGTAPVPSPLELATPHDWQAIRPKLTRAFPNWRFGATFRRPAELKGRPLGA